MASAPTTQALANAIKSAAEQNNTKDLQHLLDRWQARAADPDLLEPALSAALSRGHADAADLLLAAGCECGRAATEAAAAGLHVPSLECLLRHGWDVNYSLDHRGDALILALALGAHAPARWLLAHGADPNRNVRSAPLSGTALEAACAAGCPADLVGLLVRRGADVRGSVAALAAAWEGHVEALRVLLDEGGADINGIPGAAGEEWEAEEYWGTMLHAAAAKGRVESVRFLLARGAKTNIRNRAGRTPKETAEHFGHSECVALLG